jgi:Ig-like domain-containing protein
MQKNIRLLPILTALAILVGACLPQQAATQSSEEIAAQISTSVAQTVEAQNQILTFVAMTVDAQNTATALAQSQALPQFTSTPIQLPLASPEFTATPFVVAASGGGGGGGSSPRAQYACSWREVLPRTNIIGAGESFDVVWVITNTGTKGWPAGQDLDYVNGPKMSPFLGKELPALKPEDSVTISFVATAPTEKGLYGMQFKVEGGLCWPALNIQVGILHP